MLGISYTRRGLLWEGLYSQNVDGGCDMLEFLLDYRAFHDTKINFTSVVSQVSIFFYFGILDDGIYCPHERCWGYSLYERLAFIVVLHQFPVLWQYRDNELDKSCQADHCHCSHRAQRCWGSLDLDYFQGEIERRHRRCFLPWFISIQGQTLRVLGASALRVLY